MSSIIREFYLGNLSPDATVIKQTSELKKAMREVADAESFLREHLDGECLAALERLVAAQLTSEVHAGHLGRPQRKPHSAGVNHTLIYTKSAPDDCIHYDSN